MADSLPSSTSSPVAHISPALATLSCVSFAVFFVGSLYVFPLKTKQPREHGARYLEVPTRGESQGSMDTPHRRTSTATTTTTASDETPPASPRPSTSSLITGFVNQNHSHVLHSNGNTSSRPHSIHTDTIILATKAPVTNAKGVADNRAHRSSTHLHFLDTDSTVATAATANPTSSSSSKTLYVPSSLAHTLSNASTPASPSSLSISSPTVASLSISKYSSNAPARPEVVNHHSSTGLHFGGGGEPALPARLQSLMNGDNTKLDRDHPLVIIQRFKGILLTCFLVPFYLWWIFKFSGALDPELVRPKQT